MVGSGRISRRKVRAWRQESLRHRRQGDRGGDECGLTSRIHLPWLFRAFQGSHKEYLCYRVCILTKEFGKPSDSWRNLLIPMGAYDRIPKGGYQIDPRPRKEGTENGISVVHIQGLRHLGPNPQDTHYISRLPN